MIELGTGNFEKEVNNSETPVIVDFWAEWCGACVMMAPVFEELSHEYRGKLKFAKLNMQHEPELASAFGIRSIPTLIVFRNGNPVGSIVGSGPKSMMKAKIDEILKKI